MCAFASFVDDINIQRYVSRNAHGACLFQLERVYVRAGAPVWCVLCAACCFVHYAATPSRAWHTRVEHETRLRFHKPSCRVLTCPPSEKNAPFHWLLSVLEHLLSQSEVPAVLPMSPPILPSSMSPARSNVSTKISCFRQELQSLVSLWSLRHSFPKLIHLLSPAARPPPDVRVFSVRIPGPHGNRYAVAIFAGLLSSPLSLLLPLQRPQSPPTPQP